MIRNAHRQNLGFLLFKLQHLKNASTFGQIAVFTISVFLSDKIMLSLHIIDNSTFETISNHDFLRKVFWCEIVLIEPPFTAISTTTTQKQSDYVVEQSSFPLIALFRLKIGCCRGRNRLYRNQALSLVSITRQMPRPRHKHKAIIRLSSHPSR